jgi:hypothetical protein
VPPVVTPTIKPAPPRVVAPAAPAGIEETAAVVPTAEPTPSLQPAPAPAAVAAAAALPPAVMKSEIQAAVAVATGSPLVVQMITVFLLLGAGFFYFRFLAGKTPRFARASK